MSRRGSDRTSLALGALVALGAPCVARAQGGPPSSTQSAAALAQRNAGLDALHAGHADLAVDAFERSLALVESPNTRLDLARALEATGHAARALHEYERARDMAQARADAGRSEYILTARAAGEQADALRPRVPTLALRFVGEPPPAGTRVDVAGETFPAEALSMPLALDAGHVVVRVHGPAVRETVAECTVHDGERATLDVAPRAIAFVRVGDASLAAGTQLTLDGRPLALRDADGELPVDPGTHRLERRRPSAGRVEVVERAVRGGEHATLDFPNEHSAPASARRRTAGPSTALLAGSIDGAVGLVALAVGVASWFASDATFHALVRECGGAPCTASAQIDRANAGESLEWASVVLMIGGSVLAVGGATAVVVDRIGARERPRFSPVVAWRTAGVRVEF